MVYKKKRGDVVRAGDGDGNHGIDAAMVEKGFLARRELASSTSVCAVREGGY